MRPGIGGHCLSLVWNGSTHRECRAVFDTRDTTMSVTQRFEFIQRSAAAVDEEAIENVPDLGQQNNLV